MQASSEKLPKRRFSKIIHCARADALCALTGRLILRRHLKTTKAVFAIPNSLKGLENKEKRQVFIPAVCIGEQNEFDVEEKSRLNYGLFLAHREEILARKDLPHQLWLMMKEEKYQRIHIL